MRLRVRTWNVFHGNADPPRRRGFLHRMIEVATADRPDVVCLQEVPVWALARLEAWSRMRSFGAMTRPPLWLGPFSMWITRIHQGLFRSGLAGQANAILVGAQHEAVDLGHEQISERGRERRLVHAVRLTGPPSLVIGNLHATNDFRDPGVPRMEAARAVVFLESLLRPLEAVVLAGDFNVADPGLAGFSPPCEGIDDVLVRGASVSGVVAWERDRRTVCGVVLSDHAPVDCTVKIPA
jgi:endonuclease/exonuclease/phosphatase family metal-dependent hydrolase